MAAQKRNKDGTFSNSDELKTKITISLDKSIAEKLQRLENRSKYVEGLLFDKASEVQVISEDWEYFEDWDALQDLRLIVNHAIQKISQYKERCEMGDGEIDFIKKRVRQWLDSQGC